MSDPLEILTPEQRERYCKLMEGRDVSDTDMEVIATEHLRLARRVAELERDSRRLDWELIGKPSKHSMWGSRTREEIDEEITEEEAFLADCYKR